MHFKYEELEKMEWLLRCANQHELANKVNDMLREHWNPGTTMPPLHVVICVRIRGNTRDQQVKRTELLSAYSGEGDKGYKKVVFQYANDPNHKLELYPQEFYWRNL